MLPSSIRNIKKKLTCNKHGGRSEQNAITRISSFALKSRDAALHLSVSLSLTLTLLHASHQAQLPQKRNCRIERFRRHSLARFIGLRRARVDFLFLTRVFSSEIRDARSLAREVYIGALSMIRMLLVPRNRARGNSILRVLEVVTRWFAINGPAIERALLTKSDEFSFSSICRNAIRSRMWLGEC